MSSLMIYTEMTHPLQPDVYAKGMLTLPNPNPKLVYSYL